MKILRKIKSHANKIFAYLSLFSMLANTLAPLAAVVPSHVYAEGTSASEEEIVVENKEESASGEEADTEETADGQDLTVDEDKNEDEKTKEDDAKASDTGENKVEENGNEIENENPDEDEDVVDPEAPDIIEGGGVSDYRPIADIEDNESVEVGEIPMPVKGATTESSGTEPATVPSDTEPITTIEISETEPSPVVGEPIVAEDSAPSENIEPETPVVKVEEKEYEYLEDGAEIKDSVKEDWDVDGEVAKTIEKVKLGVKYIFPLDEEVSVTFTKLPKLEEDRDYLKIERVKVEDLNLPDDFKTDAEYAFDITTFNEDRDKPMENEKDFEYDLTLPKPEDIEVGVVYIEKDLEEVLKEEGPSEDAKEKITEEDIVEVEVEDVEQEKDEEKVEVGGLDHFTIYITTGVWTASDDSPTGIGSSEIRWGTSTGEKSGYRFMGVTTSTSLALDQPFLVGSLTHFNWPITGSEITWADLKVTLNLTDPNISKDFTFKFEHEETSNNGYCWGPGNCLGCPTFQKSDTPCDDRVTFPSAYPQESFQIGDKLYTLKLLGFVDSWPGSNPVSYFITEEEKNNTAYLVGTLSSILVPAPQISLVEKAVNGNDADSAPGPTLYVGETATFTYSVQNTGNVPLTDIVVKDDNGTPGNTSDDFTVCSGISLDPGKGTTCTATRSVVAGQYTNTAHATGVHSGTTYTSNNESANYFGVSKGSITIIKDAQPDSSQDFGFTGSLGNFNLDDDSDDSTLSNTKTFSNITPGTYTVTEPNVSGWDLTNVTCNDSNGQGNVNSRNAVIKLDAGETVTCIFTNTQQKGHLIVQKTTIPAGDSTSFAINATGTGTITGGGAGTITDSTGKDYEVTPGTYSVTETVPTGWEQTSNTCTNVVVGAGKTETCEITNTKYGSITIIKDTNPDSSQGFGFKAPGISDYFSLDGDPNSTTFPSTITFSNLSAGSYTVKEIPDYYYGWTLTSLICDDPIGGNSSADATNPYQANIDLAPGETVTCTFTNTKLPKLTITKTVINHGLSYGTDHFSPYKVGETTVTLDQATTFDPGTYTVSETADPNYTVTFDGACDSSGNVTLAAGDNKTCTITNEEKLTHLTLVKTVTNNDGGQALATAWTLTATGPTTISGKTGDTSITNAVVNSGTYTLSESGGPSGYTAGNWSCTDGSLSGNQITLSSGQSATCTITNDDIQPKLTVTKVVNGGSKQVSDFSLFVDGSSVTSGQQIGINAGQHTVSETSQPHYTGVISGDCAADGKITLNPGDVNSCTITNTYVPYCGDGIKNGTEQCDGTDGIAEDGSNLCTSTCQLIPIYDGNHECNPGTTPVKIGDTYTLNPKTGDEISISLKKDQQYLFKVYGTYNFGSDSNRVADPAYGSEDNWSSIRPDVGIWGTTHRGVLSILGNLGPLGYGIVEWDNDSTFNEDHAYEKAFTPAENITAKFLISDWYSDWYGNTCDNQSCISDNSGSLSLEVYECQSASKVTICKEDNKKRPQQGWEVVLASKKVDGPTSINVSDGSGTNSEDLPAGKYLIKVSGTYRYGSSSMDADAGFSYRPVSIPSGCDCWLSGFDLASKGLMAWVDGSPVNWGSYNSSDHTYTYVYNHSSSGPVNISIWDDYYGDNVNNNNNFQFEIYEIPQGYYGTTEDEGCVTLEDIPYGDYILDEALKDEWVNLSGKGNSVSIDSSEESFTLVNKLNAPVTIVATKIVCDYESDLPNWGYGAPNNITENTARRWLKEHPNCHAESGWNFQWGDDGDTNPGDSHVGEALGWNTFGPTNSDGVATVNISDYGSTSQIKVREVLKENYIPFTFLPNNSNSNNVSAEIYCDTDVLNYDNDDRFTPEYGKTYYCVAWNTLKRSDIYGYKWNDLNGNGKRDCDSTGSAPIAMEVIDQKECNLEPLLSGWKIFIDKNGNGTWEESEDFRITSASDPIGIGKYIFEQLPAGQTYKICEVSQTGWDQTYPNSSACHSVTVPSNCSGGQCEFSFGNYKKPALSILKFNDAEGPKKVGDIVKFTIKVTAHDNSVSEVHVYDLFSKGFEYVDNSWKATSNKNIGLVVDEPTYASPADWDLGNMVKGETITLTYEARVTEDIDPGIYNDIAWTQGEDYYGDILGHAEEGEDSGKIAENFVGTQVTVEKETPLKTDVDVKEEEKEGEVLGASTTIELPATGASTVWIKLISAIAFVGVLLLLIGGLKKMFNRRKNIAKNGKNILMHLILIGSLAFMTTKAYAASTIVRLSEPKSPATSTFDLVFVAMDTGDRNMQAECEVKKPGSSSFSAFGPAISISSGKSGDSRICPVDASVLDNEGPYTFKVKVTPEGESSSIDSNEVTVEYDSEGPDKPEYIKKEKVNDCVNKIKVKTADDEETASVKVYADDDKEVDVDDSHRIETESIGPNEKFEFEHIVSGDDCDKDWYYAVVAFDDAGNASNPRAETITTYTEGETKTEEKEEETGAIPVEGGAGLTGETGTAEGEAGEGQEEEKPEETSEEGSVLGEQTKEVSGSKSVFKSPWFWVGLVGFGIIIFSGRKKSKKAQR